MEAKGLLSPQYIVYAIDLGRMRNASSRGLLPPETAVTFDDLLEMPAIAIGPSDARYRKPLRCDASALDAAKCFGENKSLRYIFSLSAKTAQGRISFVSDLVWRLGPEFRFV